MRGLRLHGVGRIDRVFYMLHTGYRTGTQVFPLHDRGIQFKRAISCHRRTDTRIEERISLEIVDHRSHCLVALASSR